MVTRPMIAVFYHNHNHRERLKIFHHVITQWLCHTQCRIFPFQFVMTSVARLMLSATWCCRHRCLRC